MLLLTVRVQINRRPLYNVHNGIEKNLLETGVEVAIEAEVEAEVGLGIAAAAVDS